MLDPQAVLSAMLGDLGERFELTQLCCPGIPSGVVLTRSPAWKGEALQAVDAGRMGDRVLRARRVELQRHPGPDLLRHGDA